MYDTVKESLFKDMKDADLKTVRNYSLLAIGFSVTGYLMYRNRSSIYSFIELMVYTKEERINRRMNEWHRSSRGVIDDMRFCQTLITEISTGSDLSLTITMILCEFLNANRESFGPHITIFDLCTCVQNRKDYSYHGWYLLNVLSGVVAPIAGPLINDPLLISTRDIVHNFLRDLPAEATDNLLLQIAGLFKFILIYVYVDHASYRVYFPEPVWDRLMVVTNEFQSDGMGAFYFLLREQYS